MEQRLKDRQTADKVRRKLEAKSRLYDAVNNGEELDDYMRCKILKFIMNEALYSEKIVSSTLTGKKSTDPESETIVEETLEISIEEDRGKDTTANRYKMAQLAEYILCLSGQLARNVKLRM